MAGVCLRFAVLLHPGPFSIVGPTAPCTHPPPRVYDGGEGQGSTGEANCFPHASVQEVSGIEDSRFVCSSAHHALNYYENEDGMNVMSYAVLCSHTHAVGFWGSAFVDVRGLFLRAVSCCKDQLRTGSVS